MNYTIRMWGRDGLAKVGGNPDDYIPLRKYPLEDFLSLLENICVNLGNRDHSHPYKLGHGMIMHDFRWSNIFKGMDPKDIFCSTKHQDTEYCVGHFEIGPISDGEIVITMDMDISKKMWIDLWCNFYYGRIKGVFELTGHQGDVTMDINPKDSDHTCIYKILWKHDQVTKGLVSNHLEQVRVNGPDTD